MRVYFLAERESVLTVNGAYLGTVDGFERSAHIDPKDGIFCACSPAGYLPVGFRFDEAFLFAPPPQVKLYYSRGSVAVYCYDFVRADPSLTVLWQERAEGSRLTLCMQGRLQLNLENETGFHIVPLPERFSLCKPYPCGGDILLEGQGCFALLGRDGQIKVLAEGRVLERGATLKAETFYRDSCGHTAVTQWRGGELISRSVRTAREPTEATFALALMESVRIGADITPFLSDELLPKANSLKKFLGEFEEVVLTEESTLVGIVCPRKERVYDVRYFRVTITDGKVSNLKEE